jgi:hypothetical protein
MATSSANPHKLRRYSEDGLDLVQALRPQATAVDAAVRALQASRSSYIPATQVHTQLNDLVRDWYHLDEFVGDVASGFFRADAGGNGVVSVDDERLARLGQIGFADRDAAIEAARNMAAELARRRREGPGDAASMGWFIDMARRGQYDPAFAVELSRQIGVRGFADVTAMIRRAYSSPGRPISREGIAAVQVISRTLTTALDTLRNVPAAERRDPDNQYLADDQRLGRDFVRDLTTDYNPGRHATDEPGTTENDLSALLRFTDPPTAVAVAIARSRMTPLLSRPHNGGGGWGQYGGEVSNYAAMLSRNQDAAAQWLREGQNIEQVLQRPGGHDPDGGVALADLVEAGVTHTDRQDRHALMSRAIDHIGRTQTIETPQMRSALAIGVTRNMDLIDYRVNGIGWHPTVGATPAGASGDRLRSANALGLGQPLFAHDGRPELANTGIFLSEVMADGRDAARIRAATLDYAHGEGAQATTDGRNLGRLLQITNEAEINAITEDYKNGEDVRDRLAQYADYAAGEVAGRIPVAGQAYGAVEPLSGKNPTQWAMEVANSHSQAEFAAKVRRVESGRVLYDVAGLAGGHREGAGLGAFELDQGIGADGRYYPYTPNEFD